MTANDDTIEWRGSAGTAAAKYGAKKAAKDVGRKLLIALGIKGLLWVLLVMVCLLVIAAATGAIQQQQAAAAATTSRCGGSPVAITGGDIPGLTAEQSANAKAIASVALSRGLGERGVLVGVVTALTESTLVAVNYGDYNSNGTMTSSRGLFQQMSHWGSLAVRLDPAGSAGLFYDALVKLSPVWTTLTIPMAAQGVERSQFSDGSNYARNLAQAVSITTAIMAGQPAGMPTPAAGCSVASPDAMNVAVNGVAVTIPDHPNVVTALRGMTITAPTAGIAKGLAAGFGQLGLPYVWGGSNADGGGPDNGCSRGGGQLNSCGSQVGFDCSGLTAYVIVQGGYPGPGTNSGAQRNAAHAVPWGQGQPGDIIGFPGHVAINLGVIGGTQYILEASSVGIPVHIVPLTRTDHDSSLYRYWS